MSGEGEHPLSGKLNLCKSRKANSSPRLAWRHGISIPPVACSLLAAAANGGKRAAPGKLRLRLRWAQGMVSVYLLWLAVSWEQCFVRMGTEVY